MTYDPRIYYHHQNIPILSLPHIYTIMFNHVQIIIYVVKSQHKSFASIYNLHYNKQSMIHAKITIIIIIRLAQIKKFMASQNECGV